MRATSQRAALPADANCMGDEGGLLFCCDEHPHKMTSESAPTRALKGTESAF